MGVALAARSTDKLSGLAKETGAKTYACDAADPAQVDKLFAALDAAKATPDVVVYNASYRTRGPFVELDAAEVEKSLHVTAYAGFLVAQAAAKRMLPKGQGAILFTGASASIKGYAQSAPFAMGKFALRGLAQSMARELSPQGIHVAHFVIDGGIRSERRPVPRRQAGFAARSRRHRAELPARPAGSRAAPGRRNSSCGPGWRNSKTSANHADHGVPVDEGLRRAGAHHAGIVQIGRAEHQRRADENAKNETHAGLPGSGVYHSAKPEPARFLARATGRGSNHVQAPACRRS